MRASSDPEPSRPSPIRPVLLAALFLPVLALLAWQAWRAYWLCDDAFISFRYVRNLVEGHGLVFNRGEKVEGYTNFLWVLELAGLWKLLGIRPEAGCSLLSLLYTAGSIGLTAWLALTGPFRERRTLVAFGALLLLGASHTWAAWSTSGLETRQFTFFVLAAAACLHASRDRPGLLVLASLAIAAGEYTRPEGSLLFLCCLAWLVFERLRTRSLRIRELVRFALPFVLLVGLHYGWRLLYYGDFWPNTYYAKHVRAWPEAGFRYFAMAGIEFGLFLVVPAAIAGGIARLRRGDTLHLLALAILLPHAAYLVQIGGDHFEFRVLDAYWPFLAIASVEGVVAFARALPGASLPGVVRDGVAVLLLLVLVLYGSAVQVAKDLTTSRLHTRAETQRMKVRIAREDAPWLFRIPGMATLMRFYGELGAYLGPRGVAAPYAEHKLFWRQEVASFAPYEVLHREVLRGERALPEDSVTSRGSIGIFGFYLPDLVLIDAKGLTDRHVARQPVGRSNEERYMAHDRSADWPYLESRGFNLLVKPAVSGPAEALRDSNYAMRIRDDLWMPFDTLDQAWVLRAFRGGPEVRLWKVENALGCFEDGAPEGWTMEGASFLGDPGVETVRRGKLHGTRRCPGGFALDSRGIEPELPATGYAVSPAFRVPPEGAVELWLGGRGTDVGVRLLRGDEVLETWAPADRFGITPGRHDVSSLEGEDLRIEVYDESGEEGGYVVVADVTVVVPGVLDGN